MDVVFCGAIFTDLVTYAPRFPSPGETLPGVKYQTGFGGKTSNQAVMAAKLGARVGMIGRLGNDDNGRAYLKNYEEVGVDATNVTIDKQNASGVASIWVDTSTGENKIIIVSGANATLTQKEVEPAKGTIASAKALCVSLEANKEGILTAMKLAKDSGVDVFLNAAPASNDLDAFFQLTDVLCVNETEAELITGVPEDSQQTDKTIQLLLEKVPKIILTLGDKGAMYATRQDPRIKRVPAPKVDKVVDTCGAGDAFIGAFVFYTYKLGLDTEEAVRRSCQIASLSVQAEGTQSSYQDQIDLPNSLFL